MPRPERRLDPDADTVQMFACELRELRERAGGPPYRQMAKVAHYSPATLASAAGGRKLPSLAVTLAYVRACSGDEQRWEAQWREVAHAPAEAPDDDSAEPPVPYVGLAAFQPGDADRFFGRDRLVRDLQALVGQRRLVAVFGASGSGKSSLLRAGLVGRHDGPAVVFTPGRDPVEECAVHLAALTGGSAASWRDDLAADPANLHLRIRQAMTHDEGDLLVVIDQFEEVVTLCSPQDRRWLVDALTHAAGADNSRVRVVLGVRADFYGHGGLDPDLVDALRGAHLLVGPMTAQELREAITGPAVQAGYQVETALVARVVADAVGQPAVLPLVSHALRETWRRRHGVSLTLSGYEAAGGIQHAVARTAEEVFHALVPGQQQAARRLFLRLIAIGEGTEDTKRRIGLDELDDDPDTAAVIERLTDARLIVVDQTGIEMIHEALIRHWPRLGDWLTDDREGLRIHRHLTEATANWKALDRDPGALYRGARLARACEWARDNDSAMLTSEREFLDVSRTAAATERQVTRRRMRQLRWLAAGLTALLLVCGGVAVIAIQQRQEADKQQHIALSRQLAANAQQAAARDIGQALRLSLEAYKTAPTTEARSSLLSLASRPTHEIRIPLPPGTGGQMALSRDGRWLAASVSCCGGSIPPTGVLLWDIQDDPHPVELPGSANLHPEDVTALKFSSDGHQLATGTIDGHIRLWSIPHRTLITEIDTHTGPVLGLAYTPDGTRLAAAAPPGDFLAAGTQDHAVTVKVWTLNDTQQIASWQHSRHTDVHFDNREFDITFSPDGRTLASTGDDNNLVLWDVATATALPSSFRGTGPLAYSPDGTTIATIDADGSLNLWNTTDHTRRAITGISYPVSDVAYSPDGSFITTTNTSGTVQLADIAHGTTLLSLPTVGFHERHSIAISANGVIAEAGDDAIRIWSSADVPYLGGDFITDLSFGPGQRTILATSRTAALMEWDVTQPTQPTIAIADRDLVGADNQQGFAPAQRPVFSQDGSRLAVFTTERKAAVYDVATRTRIAVLGVPFGDVSGMAFSPNGHMLATSHTLNGVVVWDIDRQQVVAEQLGGPGLLTFSPDGHHLAIQGSDTIQIWNITAKTVDTRLPLRTKSLLSTATYSPDDNTIATTEDGDIITIWDTQTGRHIADLNDALGHSRTTFRPQITFSPNGKLLATISRGDASITLWDTTTWTQWATLTGHTGPITAATWSPDSTLLATASTDHTITTWQTNIDNATHNLCRIVALNNHVDDKHHDTPCP